ncbi:MAG: hypothetical protein GQF41_3615 [Candidatus Rifleibacterium amylolyticum]|nr:MAG: hypothetical protein GQF41_3615 [Candidatus Rifleibacterium amylolyticum]
MAQNKRIECDSLKEVTRTGLVKTDGSSPPQNQQHSLPKSPSKSDSDKSRRQIHRP